jgi:hypothetical protein
MLQHWYLFFDQKSHFQKSRAERRIVKMEDPLLPAYILSLSKKISQNLKVESLLSSFVLEEQIHNGLKMSLVGLCLEVVSLMKESYSSISVKQKCKERGNTINTINIISVILIGYLPLRYHFYSASWWSLVHPQLLKIKINSAGHRK